MVHRIPRHARRVSGQSQTCPLSVELKTFDHGAMSSRIAQVTFRIEGPMKRSTFQAESPDTVEQAINDLLHWSWSTRLQIRRLATSLRACRRDTRQSPPIQASHE